MRTLLHLDASPRGNLSISRQLSAAAVAAWKDKYPGGKVIERDLTKTAMTFVDLDWITGAFSTPDQLTDRQKSALAISDTLIAQQIGGWTPAAENADRGLRNGRQKMWVADCRTFFCTISNYSLPCSS